MSSEGKPKIEAIAETSVCVGMCWTSEVRSGELVDCTFEEEDNRIQACKIHRQAFSRHCIISTALAYTKLDCSLGSATKVFAIKDLHIGFNLWSGTWLSMSTPHLLPVYAAKSFDSLLILSNFKTCVSCCRWFLMVCAFLANPNQ